MIKLVLMEILTLMPPKIEKNLLQLMILKIDLVEMIEERLIFKSMIISRES